MLILVSPAKRLNDPTDDGFNGDPPQFEDQARDLVEVARDLTVSDLKKLMRLSDNLAKLNHDRFRDFGTMPHQPAALAFAGDTYIGLEAATLDDDEMAWAGDHLRILSGLYGLLRPMDAIEPYRLEMGSRLANPRGRNLYEFWGGRISLALNEQARRIGTDVVINCASQEYFGAVAMDALNLRVVTPVFMEMRPSGPKIVSFYAKKARGAMARFIVQNRLVDPDAIKEFDVGGYKFQSELSHGDNWIFLREEPA